MRDVKWLRTLVGVEIGLVILSWLASFRLEHTLPAPLQAFLRDNKNAPMTGLEAAVGTAALVWMAGKVVVWVGLFRRWRVAPWLYLASWIAVLLIDLAAGPNVETAVETTLNAAWAVVGGAILVLSLLALGDATASGDRASTPGP
jgi:hypothetical protein